MVEQDRLRHGGNDAVLNDMSITFERRLAYDKLTFFYISLPSALIGQMLGALLLSALMLTSVDLYSIIIWTSLSAVMFLYRFYHYYVFKNASEYGKLADATVWLHKFYINVLISGIVWGSSAILLFPPDNLIGQMVIVLFLFTISFTSIGILASKKELLLGYTSVMFLPILLRFFFLDGGEEYTTIAYVILALMLILLLIAYYFGGVVNDSLKHHQYFIEIKHSHDQLKERFFSLFERAPVGIYYFNRELRIQDVNAQFLKMHHIGFKEDLIGQEIRLSDDPLLVDAHEEALRNHAGSFRGPYKRFFANDVIYADLSTVPMLDNNGEVTGGITIIKDITAEVTAKEEMLRNAYYDMLTEIPNRTLLMDNVNQALETMKRTGDYASLLFIDIDRFKKVNDTYGHNVGDSVIKQVAFRIEEAVEADETLARIGGDKFVVLCPGVDSDVDTARHEAMEKALLIKRKFVAPLKIAGEDFHVTLSMGIEVFNGFEDSAYDVLKRAETAMYQAKNSGRNSVAIYKESMGSLAEEQLVVQNELFKALRADELQVFYQPQLSVSGREIVSAEALVRWFHPEKGPIPPDKFVRIAEESGIIVELENWIFERIFSEMKAWSGRCGGLPLDHIAINVSAIHFLQPHFVERFMLLTRKYAIDPAWISLELTESELMHNIHEAIRKIEHLRTFGVTFSIDDFGTGYSSLSYVKQLPADELKIDQSFVLNMADNYEDALIVSAIITIAKKFGLRVLAEGVENERVLELLEEMGCDAYQGYLAYKPMPLKDFEEAVAVSR